MKKPLIIFIAAFLYALCINAVQFSLIFHIKETMGGNATAAGAVVGSFNFFYVASCLIGQHSISRLPTRLCLKIALLIAVLGGLCICFAKGYVLAFTGLALFGASSAFFWPPLMGWLSEGLEGPELARISGIFNLCWSAGSMTCPLVSGPLCDWNPHGTLCLVTGVFFLLFLALLPARENTTALPKATDKPDDTAPAGRETRLRYAAWIGLAATFFIVGFLCSSYPYIAEAALNLSRTRIGTLLTCRGVANSTALFLLGFTVFWQYNRRQLIAGHALLALSLVALGYLRNELAIGALMIVIGALCGLNYLNSQFHGVAGSKNRTQRMFIHETMLSAGAIIGSFLTGWLFERLQSLTLVCLVCAAVMGLATIADLLLPHDSKPTTPQE